MKRTTIDFGIDLGTTNSSIAQRSQGKLDVFKNNEDQESTPSAVYIDKNNNLIVGRVAKERVESDPENAFHEFKREMGTGFEYVFKRTGRRIKPEELSAEVLKTLLASVQQRTGHRPDAAVITVPAAFGLDQCKATKRAAELAGLREAPLLTEPVAAALAYGFQNERDGVYWLVYDFGGGTFDAAVTSVQEGFIEVVAYHGDKNLGGKDIDWAIVDELLIPAVTQKFQVADFGRKKAKWRGAIAKLKGAAEEAKIQLSTAETADIDIDFLCQDDQGEPIEFQYSLSRTNVERLAEPLILRSIRICKTALEEKRLASGTIEKVLLVGGPTRMPYLRKRLVDELKIPLEFRLDPMTSVAQGAAIFASMQRLEADPVAPPVQGEYNLMLEGKPAGPETEPHLGGTVRGQEGEDLRSFTIEFVNSTIVPPWKSGAISLGPNGRFLTTLWAEARHINRFDIHLSDAAGRLHKTTPDHWQYEVTIGIAAQPMITTVGVGLANNGFRLYIEKGAPLPARQFHRLVTAFPVSKGQRDPFLCVPVFEGDNSRADRNRRIGELKVSADKLTRDLPAGTDVEVTISIDASRLVQVQAWIPTIDEEFNCTINLGGPTILLPAEQLILQVRHEKERLDELRKQAAETTEPMAAKILRDIDAHEMLKKMEQQLDLVENNPQLAASCEATMIELRVILDKLEEILAWPILTSEAELSIEQSRPLIQEKGSASERQSFTVLEREIHQALASRDTEILKQKVGELEHLRITIRIKTDGGRTMVTWFLQLEQQEAKMTDRRLAQQLIAEGHRAMEANNLHMLQQIVLQLIRLREEEWKPLLDSTVMAK